MEYSEKDSALTYEWEAHNEAISTECQVEYTLPDYMPEIRKILTVNARAVPVGRYCEEGKAEFSGLVAFTVIYSDGDGRLSACSVNGEYRLTCPVGGHAGIAPYEETEVDAAVCRLHGPRRLTLRCGLRSRVHTVEALPIPTPEGEGYERLCRRTVTRVTHLVETGEIAFSDAVTVPTAPPDSLRLLFCDGSLQMDEVRPGEGTLTLRGVAHVRLVAADEAGQPYAFAAHVPLEREIGAEGVSPEDRALFDGCLSLIGVRSTGDGEGGTRFEIDGTAEGRVRLYRNRELCPTVQPYSPAFRTEVQRAPLLTERLLGTASGSYTVSGGGSATGEEPLHTILDSSATATVRKITEEGGRPVVLGDVRIKHLLVGTPTEAAPAPCTVAEYSYPFRIEAPLGVAAGERRYECTVRPVAVRGHLSEGGYAADTELSLSLAAFGRESFSVVSSVTPHPEEAFVPDAALVRVVYPDPEDSLWSLAERYHTTPAAIAGANGLPPPAEESVALPSSLDGVAYLLLE